MSNVRNETMQRSVLVVDDDPDLLKLLALRLGAAGYGVQTAESGERALAAIAVSRPDVVVTDLKMGGMDGLALFDAVQRTAPTLPVIILTAHGTIPDAVDATKRGVFGFLPKPFEGKELVAQVEQALKLSSVASGTADGGDWRADFITASPRMEDLLRRARLVAQSDASVLIVGASGTGKELLARAIHGASKRAEAPFVAVNCAAIPEALLESELFGHRKGSFTGAIYDHKGLFQSAEGGTVFLDEIGDMPVALQSKLLRALQEREVRPIGTSQAVPVDVRIISATHRNLEERVASGEFREDLYYRLNVVSFAIPTLAERPEDILPLARHFLTTTAARYGKDVRDPRAGRARAAGRRAVAGQRAAARQRRRAGGRARHLADRAGGARRERSEGGARRAHAARRGEARVRARLPDPDPADHQGQRLPRRAPRPAQPHGVLQAARPPPAPAVDVQGGTRHAARGALMPPLRACRGGTTVPGVVAHFDPRRRFRVARTALVSGSKSSLGTIVALTSSCGAR